MEEENGLTLGEIFKVIFKRVWWLLGAAALCVIVAVLVTQLWYNKNVQYYSVTYEILYPDSSGGKYPDGKDFVIADSISLNTLTRIVEDNEEEFGGINVEKMVANDSVDIKQGVAKLDDGSVTRTYTLTVKANYFKSDAQAVEFMKAIANYPVDRVNAVVREREYELYLTTYDNAKTYVDRLNALSSQKDYLQSSYTSLMKYDNSLDVKLAELRTLFTSVQKQALLDRLDSNYYILAPEEYTANAEYRKKVLSDKIADNNNIIKALEEARDKAQAAQGGQETTVIYSAALYDQDVITNAYDYRIAALVAENATMQNEIDNIEITCDAIELYMQEGTKPYSDKQKFDALLAEYRAELAAATAQLKTDTIELYRQNSRVIYAGNNVQRQGGMGAVTAAVIGLLLGLVVAGAVICIIDLPKYKRAKLAAGVESAAVGGAEAGAPAETAENPEQAE